MKMMKTKKMLKTEMYNLKNKEVFIIMFDIPYHFTLRTYVTYNTNRIYLFDEFIHAGNTHGMGNITRN